MRQRLLVVFFLIFTMTASPVLSWVGADAVATLTATPPKKPAAAKKPAASKPKQKSKPAAKKQSAKPAAKKQASKPVAKKPATRKPQVAKSNRPSAKPQTKPAKQNLTPEEEAAAYQERVEEVQRYNAKVAAYMNRDIAHRLGIWGQAGCSAIFPGN